MVLAILLEMTSPMRSLRLPRFSVIVVEVGLVNGSAIGNYAAFLRSCEMRVSIRAMSRRNVRNRADFSSWALACCRRRLKISWRKFRPSASNSGIVFSWISLRCVFFISGMAGNEFRLDWQLGRRQAKRLARHRFGHAIDFEQN